MNEALATTARWTVSTRADGEVLTASAGAEGLEFAVVGFPDRFTREEIAGWLKDLTGVARETALGDASARTIPPLLHHALTGLLFSHAELWESDGISRPCSAAFVQAGGRVAFGWVGEVLPEVWVDEGPLVDVYTRVRDEEGREAFGISFDAVHRLRVRLTWTTLPGAVDAPSGVIEAEWAGGPAGFEETLAMDTLAIAALAEPRIAHAEIVHPGASGSVPSAGSEILASPSVAETHDPLADTPAESGPAEGGTPSAEPAGEERVVEEATAALELPGEGAEKQGLFRRIASWLRRRRTGETVAEVPAGDEAATADASVEVTPGEREALAGGPTSEASLDDEPGAGTHERLFPQTPAPPGLARDEEAIEDPHVRELGPVAETPAPPAPPASRVVERGPAGPPMLRVSPISMEPPADPPGEPPASPPRLTLGSAGAAARGPRASAPPVTGPPLDAGRGIPALAAETTPVPTPPESSRPIAAAATPAAWEPPASIIADASGASSEETALAAALAALAAEAQANVAPPDRLPDVAPVPVSAPRSPSLETSDAMRAALAARASAATMPALEHPVETPPTPVAAEATIAGPATDPVIAVEAGLAERVPLHPEWPSAEQLQAPTPLWKRPWVWVAMVVALFIGGWLVGLPQPARDHAPRRSPLLGLMRGIGLGGARYDVMVNSHPSGAWIAVDGKDLARRTPASIDLAPGEHAVTLSMSDLGGATFKVHGQRGEQLALDAPLWGTLDVLAADGAPPVTVTVDGHDVGFAPVHLEGVQPGAHDLRFSGPGMPAWGQPVEVRVAQKAEVIARPMTSPATGVIVVRASITDDQGTRALPGAAVIVDGEPRGGTPLTLEVPRGPHSVRVTYRDQSAPVQVIDLPGGNQRFAQFELGLGGGRPQLLPLEATPRFTAGRTAVISTGLDGVDLVDVREMWLHVRTPEGAWRRYQMETLRSPTGVVGVAVFPTTLFSAGARVRWYTSATVSTGDEYFTEIGDADVVGAASERRAAR